ncbi:MAG: hypothetical protein RL701_2798 [Pseudomonadota bacterium]|jgi:hypothetical protein
MRHVLAYGLWLQLLSAPALAFAADPTTADCLSANERSIALRNQHQLRAARAELLVCAAGSCPEDVRNECARRVADVNAQMPTIVFELKDREGNDVSAVAVTMDGQPLAARLEGTALSIDPGEHNFVFTAQNAPPVQKRLIIRESEKGRREKIVLGAEQASGPVPQAPPAGDAPPAAPFTSTAATLPPPATASTSGSGSTQRIIGIVVGGVGVVGLGVALFEQVTANNRYAASERAANSLDPVVGSSTHRRYEEAKDAQTLAIIFGAVGAVALGTGLVLVLTSFGGSEHAADARATAARSTWQVAPIVGPGGAALTLSSQF